MSNRMGWVLLVAANVLLYCVLGFCQNPVSGQRTGGDPPFANAVEQRNETIAQLKEIKDLLKEQNALLKSGTLQVVVTLPEKH